MWKKSGTSSNAITDFDQVVMLAVLHLSPEAYGISIRNEIETRTGRGVSLSTVYSTLARLEARGCVRSQLGNPTPERGGRRKRLFAIQPVGKTALAEGYRAFKTMVRGLERTLERA